MTKTNIVVKTIRNIKLYLKIIPGGFRVGVRKPAKAVAVPDESLYYIGHA